MSVKTNKARKKNKPIELIEQSLFGDELDLQKKVKQDETKETQSDFSSVAELLNRHPIKESNKYISQEFQAYGCHLAIELEDQVHTSLYIKLAKTYPRAYLEQALAFVSDAGNARSKAKLFMWKLHQLKKNKNNTQN